ncbi:MAG: protein kinase [Planctomycetes bacterium]|nr:protein kinase [Planctomycetota bacterium]
MCRPIGVTMSECLSFTRILQYSRGETEVSPAEQEHLRSCPQCEEQLKLASDDTVLEDTLREAARESGGSRRVTTSVIGEYEIVREIGRGGMGVVYEAVQRSLNRSVALKVLPALLHSLRPESGERFKAEAAAAARLQHPNIVPIYDYGQDQDCHYYAMELIHGQSLGELVKEYADASDDAGAPPANQGSAYYRRVAGWMADVADALQFAHDAGVIHRDIKPNNLILCETGRVMVSDFGLAKDMTQEAATRSGQLMGTWRYMSPEQVRGGGANVDQRTDIYSLGATLYELLTFQPAIPGGHEHEMIQKVLEHEPTSPRKIIPRIPNDLEVICLRAMAKDLGARYQTAAELSADLRRYLNDEPIRARRIKLHVRLGKYVRRHRYSVAVILVGVFVTTSIISTAAYLDSARERAELSSYFAGFLVTRAKNHLDAGHYNKAIQAYSNALARDPSLTYVYASRASAYAEVGLLEEAIQDLDRAIELSPLRSGPFFRRGVLRLIQGNTTAAAANFDQALRLNPNEDSARVFRSLARQQAGGGDPVHLTDPPKRHRPHAKGDALSLLAKFHLGTAKLSTIAEAASTPQVQGLVYCAAADMARLNGDPTQAAEWFQASIDAHDEPGVVRLFCRHRLSKLSGE